MKKRSENSTIFHEKIYPHFLALSKCARAPKREREAIELVKSFTKTLGLPFETDSHGNILVHRKSSPGHENAKPLLFQGHLDMVCVPDENIFPVKPVVTDGWVHTEGTTLGADNGIAVAIMFELMQSEFDKNPPLEFLFTVSEEVGLMGASIIETEKFHLKSSMLINIDSEEIDFITVGCAGGQDFQCSLPIEYEDVTDDEMSFFAIEVSAPGGHSGMSINKEIPNAIKIAHTFLHSLLSHRARIAQIHGGLARNAIPAKASAIFAIKNTTLSTLKKHAEQVLNSLKINESCEITIKKIESQTKILSQRSNEILMEFLKELPHGVIKTNVDTGGVLSSVNLAIVENSEDDIVVKMNARSSVKQEMDAIYEIVSVLCSYLGAKVERGDRYPGWRPDLDSNLLKITEKAFEDIRGTKAKYLDIHAGLECGVLMSRFSGIKESVSIGPNILNAHSIEEKLEIESTGEIWRIINNIITYSLNGN